MNFSPRKARFFEGIILDFFQKSGRQELPWRKKGITPYEVWVSEVMLQQTQVSRVTAYYRRFLKKFPTVEILSRASWEEFLPYYEGLGYYARGRNMLKTAESVVKNHNGIFPRTKEALMVLPGIGEYTASAILSFAYGKNILAWDTNLKRVIGRFFFGSKRAVFDFQQVAKVLAAPRKKLNAALMDFGSHICTSRPKCGNCPLQSQCLYYQTKGKKESAPKKEKVKFPLHEAKVLLFLHENHRQYYSSRSRSFAPFTLPKGYNSRAAIKDWFFQKYGLRLSVRPPHQKIFFQKTPTVLVNAQVLAGKPAFSVFPKSTVTEYTKRIHKAYVVPII